MKRKSVISLLLSLSLFCTMLLPGTTAYAAESTGDNGMVISKTATANDDGTYTVRLEAYATGGKVITQEKKDIPTDIVLVLDQSGSMDNDIGTVSFKAYTNRQNSSHYNNRHNGGNANLYYPLGNGAYASVSVTVQETATYTSITNGRNNSTSGGATNYWEARPNLYAKVDGEYQKVTLTREGGSSGTYIYALPDGTIIATSTRRNGVPAFSGIDGGVLYLRSVDNTKSVYTYTYTDASGAIQTIGTSTGATNNFATTLYQRVTSTTGGGSRLDALKTSLNAFTKAVNEKAAGKDGEPGTADDVNHRIAVVGYAYGDTGYGNAPAYTNTEVFIGSTQYGYGNSARSVYGSAFQDMNSVAGQTNVAASIGALTANGATYTDLGVEMANGILAANPVKNGEKRNRVVIVFTDGLPGWSSYEPAVANNAISQANSAKNAGTTVYSVGIFAGADASSAGNANGSDTEKANWFMQNLSSNNGTPKNPSYYLSAADADTLNNIFQQISDNIETGGSSTTLNEETVVKDIISPYFTLPEGATGEDITLETYACTGKEGDAYTWRKNTDAMGAVATVDGDQVSVTGFDFAENYVGTVTENGTVTYRGHKLVIEFTVSPKDEFLGGNNVPTNTSADIYENSTAAEPVLTFEKPEVNVPIKDVTVTPEDKHVYLLQDLTADQLRSGAKVQVGGVELDLSQENYGLEDWQHEYVNITVEIRDQNGNVITDLNDLKEDGSYTISVTVASKYSGTDASGTPTTAKSGSGTGNIYVYKPELTFRDSTVYYGDIAPTDFSGNLAAAKWKHGTNEADPATMGQAPELNLTYTPEAGKIADGKINTKQDIEVDVDVKLGNMDVTEYTTFLHEQCHPACDWDTSSTQGTPAFLLHVKTCQLTITKTGGAAGEPYVFGIYKDNKLYTEITIVGNDSVTIYELPVGNYTIQEDTGWSWRYTPSYSGSAVLDAGNPNGSITCTNTSKNDHWLGGFSEVVANIFGIEH